MRPSLFVVIVLLSAAPVAAQQGLPCSPWPYNAAVPPDPVPRPTPAGAPANEARVGLRELVGAGAPLHVAGTPDACATLATTRLWTGSEWGSEQGQRVMAFDEGGRTTDYRTRRMAAGTLYDDFRQTQSYGPEGLMRSAERFYAFPPGSPLRENSRFGFTHDAGGRLMTTTYDQWDASTSAWRPFSRSHLSYGGRPFADTVTFEGFAPTGWLLDVRHRYLYTPDGALAQYDHDAYLDGEWTTTGRDLWHEGADGRPAVRESFVRPSLTPALYRNGRQDYTYDAAGRLVTVQDSICNTTCGALRSRDTYTYDTDGRLVEHLREARDPQAGFRPEEHLRYVYDAEGRLAETFIDTWVGGVWGPLWRQIHSYDAEGRLAERVSMRWIDGAWVNSAQTLFTYGQASAGTTAPGAAGLTVSVGPNPSTGTAWVRFVVPSAGSVAVRLVDALGRTVRVLADEPLVAGLHTRSIDLRGMGAGAYSVVVATADGTVSRRLSVVR